MVKFNVEKNAMAKATTLLNQVSNLKSVGASPSESSGLRLSPTTITLMNINEANGVLIENIPITIIEGDVTKHLDSMYMVNTKKLDNIVKGSGTEVTITILEDKVVVGESKRIYELSMFTIDKKDPPEIKPLGYSVAVDEILKNMEQTTLITDNAVNMLTLSGTLFSGLAMTATDKISALHIKKSGLFGEGASDVLMTTDLFSTCLSKVEGKEAFPGLTTDGKRFFLKIGNTILYKTLLSEAFPKDTIYRQMSSVEHTINNSEANKDVAVVKVVMQLSDFRDKLREIHTIVEAEDYFLSYHREGFIQICNNNMKSGADGTTRIDAQVTFPPAFKDNVIDARYSFVHLDLINKLFQGNTEIVLYSPLGAVGGIQKVRYIGVRSEEKMYIFTPKA